MVLDSPTAAHFSSIAHRLGDAGVLRRRELTLLATLIEEGEDVFGLTHGVMTARTWVLALTDKRLILLSHSRIFGLRRIDIALRDLGSILPAIGPSSGSLEIVTLTEQRVLYKVPRRAVEPFALAALKFAILGEQQYAPASSENRVSRALARAILDLT